MIIQQFYNGNEKRLKTLKLSQNQGQVFERYSFWGIEIKNWSSYNAELFWR